MSAKRVIIPHPVVGQEFEEAKLAAETLPGTLVTLTGSPHEYTATKNATRGFSCWIVDTAINTLFGKNCRQAIPANERATVALLQPGMRVTVIAKSAVAVAVGDYLVPDTDGLVDAAAAAVTGSTTPTGTVNETTHVFTGAAMTLPAVAEKMSAPCLLQALEACSDAATGDSRRIECRVVRN